jgi:hypothetical protein
MNYDGNKTDFPRELSALEKDWISSALPDNKPGYKKYKEKLFSLFVIGKSGIEDNSIILGKKDSIPEGDLVFPVFASGNIVYKTGYVYVTVSSEEEGLIEIDFDVNVGGLNDLSEIKRWSYSDWLPGRPTPEDNSMVREIDIIKKELILAAAPSHKRIWIYEDGSGINHLIPVTNFYNELMRTLKIKDPEIALDSNKFFTDLDKYRDEDLAVAFLTYNKRWKKVDIDYSVFKEKSKKDEKSFFGFIKRR